MEYRWIAPSGTTTNINHMITKKKKQQNGTRTGKYKSLLEKRIANELKKGMKSSEYEATVLPYTIRKNYSPDFVCHTRSGKTIYIETKGYFTVEDRSKMRAVKDTHPTLDIRLVFDKDNKISSKGKLRYSGWCELWGFKYAIKKVPKEWFNE